jgi:hypothetical protein
MSTSRGQNLLRLQVSPTLLPPRPPGSHRAHLSTRYLPPCPLFHLRLTQPRRRLPNTTHFLMSLHCLLSRPPSRLRVGTPVDTGGASHRAIFCSIPSLPLHTRLGTLAQLHLHCFLRQVAPNLPATEQEMEGTRIQHRPHRLRLVVRSRTLLSLRLRVGT